MKKDELLLSIIKKVVIVICAIVFVFLSVKIINVVYPQDIPLGFSCYYEDAVLLNQYISNTSYTGGGNCSEGCLFMDVYTEHIYFLPCGHIEKVVWENRTYYFAGEHRLRNDLKEGDNISVKWCYINDKIGRRIREIKRR